MIVGYNVTKQRICILELVPDCTVANVERWVEQHLDVNGKLLLATLGSSAIFEKLYLLVRAIAESCNKEDFLVFSPSQELHVILLHALPYLGADARPVIDFHSIVYSTSNIILKACVMRVTEENSNSPTSASLFGRWGVDHDQGDVQEQNIK